MALKKIKRKPVRKTTEGEIPPPQKCTLETAPLYMVHLLDILVAEIRGLRKDLRKAISE
jgi:hypothetical protein